MASPWSPPLFTIQNVVYVHRARRNGEMEIKHLGKRKTKEPSVRDEERPLPNEKKKKRFRVCVFIFNNYCKCNGREGDLL